MAKKNPRLQSWLYCLHKLKLTAHDEAVERNQ
jgi:hypothetical protein